MLQNIQEKWKTEIYVDLYSVTVIFMLLFMNWLGFSM